jgi:hypothetical protein
LLVIVKGLRPLLKNVFIIAHDALGMMALLYSSMQHVARPTRAMQKEPLDGYPSFIRIAFAILPLASPERESGRREKNLGRFWGASVGK